MNPNHDEKGRFTTSTGHAVSPKFVARQRKAMEKSLTVERQQHQLSSPGSLAAGFASDAAMEKMYANHREEGRRREDAIASRHGFRRMDSGYGHEPDPSSYVWEPVAKPPKITKMTAASEVRRLKGVARARRSGYRFDK